MHFAVYKTSHEELSVRKWAKILGVNTPELLMDILKRKKKMSLNLVKDVSKGLKLDPSEQLYFEVMVKFANETSAKEKQLQEILLAEIAQLRGTKILVEDNDVFSHWVHMAILTMSRLKNIKCNKETIQEYLLEPVSQEIIDQSIDRLVRLDLIKSDENGNLTRTQDHTTSKNDAFQKSPHNYFEQVSELAKKGSQVLADEREFQCFSLAITHEQIPAFKEVIRNFRAKVAALADTENADQVYQFNIQFFPLTSQVIQPPLRANQGVLPEKEYSV